MKCKVVGMTVNSSRTEERNSKRPSSLQTYVYTYNGFCDETNEQMAESGPIYKQNVNGMQLL